MSKPAPITESSTSTAHRCYTCHAVTCDFWFSYQLDRDTYLACLACAVHGDEVFYSEKGPHNYLSAGLAAVEHYWAGNLPSIHTLLV